MTPAVLLVDDRSENLLALEAVLEPLSCRLVSVTSGEAALKALLQDDFAVVLLDVQMPELDGFETAELIKQRERTRAVPIIFVTAISKEERHVYRGYETGAVDYLFKPYDPDVLRAKVRVFLELDARTRAAAESEALLRATFTSAPVGLARLDGDGRIAEANSALAGLLGFARADLADRLLESFVAATVPPEWFAALRDGRVPETTEEVRLVTRDGVAIPCQLTFARAAPTHGLPVAVVLGVQDLREGQAAEREREQRLLEQTARAEAERVADHHRKLGLISDATLGPLDFEDLVAELLKRTAEALSVDTAVAVVDDVDGRTLAFRVVGSGEDGTRWYSVVSADESPAGETAFGDRMVASLTAPMSAEGTAIGSLRVGTLFDRRFTPAEQGLLQLAADRIALAIQRARLFDRQRTIAEQLQRSLLPEQLPDVAGLSIEARYCAAEAGAQVGGDWYDAILGHGRLLLAIGDVAGRGIAAAATMGRLRSALRAYAMEGHGPAEILARLNAFALSFDASDLATVGLIAVDVAAGELRFANAGHPPALVVGAAGESTWLDKALGPPVGAMCEATYAERVMPLSPGTTLVLYTDGLVEQRSEPIDEGLARLRDTVATLPGNAGGICDAIIERMLFSAITDDDVTLLVLRTPGERTAAPAEEPTPFYRRRPGAPARLLATGAWPHRATRSARVEIEGGAEAGAAARQLVEEALTGAVSDRELSDVRSVVAEIVNNAVVHGTARTRNEVIEVHLAASERAIRVEICGPGDPFEVRAPSAAEEPGGFGLVIIDRLTSRWGLDFDPGVCVWLEIDRGPGSATRGSRP